MSENPLKLRIQEDMKNAMRAKDAKRLGVIRLMLAAIKQKEIDERINLNDSDIANVLSKMIKQRRDSVEQYTKAQRQDLADQESFEITVIEGYMPQALSDTEINDIIKKALFALEAKSIQDLGKVITHIKPIIQGRADMRLVSEKVKELLQG